MILRFREDKRNDRHTWVSVFSGHYLGPETTTLGKSGDLCLDTDVWDSLKTALSRAGSPGFPLPDGTSVVFLALSEAER